MDAKTRNRGISDEQIMQQIKQCIRKDCVEKLPQRLKLWETYEQSTDKKENLSNKASLCEIYAELCSMHPAASVKFIEMSVICHGEYYLQLPVQKDNICHLFLAIQTGLLNGCTHLLPEIPLQEQNVIGNQLFLFLSHVLPHLPFPIQNELLHFLLLKLDHIKNSGWLVKYSFDASISPISFIWLVMNALCSREVLRVLLEHGMRVTSNDINCAICELEDDEYSTVESLLKNFDFRHMHECINPDEVALSHKKYKIAAVLLSVHLTPERDQMLHKICINKNTEPDDIKKFSSKLSPELRSIFITQLICSNKNDKEKKELLKIVLDSGNIDSTVVNIPNLVNKKLEFFLIFKKILFHLLERLDSHSPAVLTDIVKIILKHPSKDLDAKVSLVFKLIQKGAHVSVLSAAYSGRSGSVIHAAVELALRTGNTKFLSEVCKKFTAYPTDGKLVDSRGCSPLHVVTMSKKRENAPEVCQIICSLSHIDPLLTNDEGKAALEYCKRKGDKCANILEMAKASWSSTNRLTPIEETPTITEVECTPKQIHQSKNAHQSPSEISSYVDKKRHDEISSETFKVSTNPNRYDATQSLKGTQTVFEIEDNLESLMSTLLEKPPEYFSADECSNKLEDSDSSGDENIDKETLENDLYQIQNSPVPITRDNNEIFPNEDRALKPEENPYYVSQIDDENFDFSSLPWEIVISKQASDFLKRKKSSAKVIRDIKRKLKRIGEGDRADAICHRCVETEDNLYETYLYRSARIIWQEDIQYSERLSDPANGKVIYTDVIKILWITLKHSINQLNDVLQRIKSALRKSRHSFTGLVRFREAVPPLDDSHFKQPRLFIQADDPNSKDIVAKCHPIPNLYGGEFSVMQFHPFFEFLNALLNEDPLKRECSINMSPQEHKIVMLPYKKQAVILCGRSGTGKTTTCVYRMWNEFKTFWENHFAEIITEEEYEDSGDGNPEEATKEGILCATPDIEQSIECPFTTDHTTSPDDPEDQDENMDSKPEPVNLSKTFLHQIFLTKSPVLCSQVKKQFDKLLLSNQSLRDRFQRNSSQNVKHLLDYQDAQFPLFLTSRKFLLLLDFSLEGEKFFSYNENGELLVDIDYCDYNEDADPERLFEDWDDDEDQDSINKEDIIPKSKRTEVTADYFRRVVWQNIMRSEDKHLDPLLIWTEIQSFIKGAMDALQSEGGCLSEDQYINNIGRKMAPVFSDDEREQIYHYFEAYKHFRSNQRELVLFDECDIVHSIYQRLKKQHHQHTPPEWYIDHFYIDEIQDFTQAEMCLLLKCCRNPNGTFCTGDVAQSIMKGVFFRFEDLKSQFWRLAQCSLSNVPTPSLHILTDNFRSHSGVLNLAQSVVDILKNYFKSAFQDSNLPPEKALFAGPQPILLETTLPTELAALLLGSDDVSSTPHELGAYQAIIVRSDESRKSLPEPLKHGIVLTVLEAKGLEFNDVLLYNFFSDSEVSSQWRFLYNLIEDSKYEAAEETLANLQVTSYPLRQDRKQETKLKSLSAELKHLYTAVTRARKNLWFYDSDKKKRGPAFSYWLLNNLARIVKTDIKSFESNDSLIFAAPSQKEQWSKQGEFYFRMGRWELAMKCFGKGEVPHQLHLARGYMLVEEARHSQMNAVKKHEDAAMSFLTADKHHHSVEYIDKAVYCLRRANFHEEAASLLEKLGKYDIAAREWTKAGKHYEVARVKEILGDYSGAVRSLMAHEDYKKALSNAVRFEKEYHTLDPDVTSQQIASEYFRRNVNEKDKKEELKGTLQYISEGSIKAAFLKEIGLYEEAIDELMKEKHYHEAYRMLQVHGLFAKGFDVANDKETKGWFLFLHTTSLLINNDWKQTDEIENNLQRLEKYSSQFQAQSQLLSAKVHKNPTFCRKAMMSFNKSKSTSGELAAYELLKKLQIQTAPLEDLKMSKSAFEVAEAIIACSSNQGTYKQKSIFNDVLFIHHLTDDKSDNMYHIAPFLLENNLSLELSGISAFDCKKSDGMVVLNLEEVHSSLTNHYRSLSKLILNNDAVSSFFKKQVLAKLVTTEFHKGLQTGQFQQSSFDVSVHKYFDNLKQLVEYNFLAGQSLGDNNEAVLRLFSPTAAFFVPVMRSNLRFLKQSNLVCQHFKRSALEILKDQDVNLDGYFTAWRLLLVFTGNTNARNEVIKAMKSSRSDTYTYEYNKERLHVFNGWLVVHKQIHLQARVTLAAKSAYNYIFSRIANMGDVRNQAISIYTLTYISSVLSTALISMLTVALSNPPYISPNFLIPFLYSNLITNFDSFNVQGSHEIRILEACYQHLSSSHNEWLINQSSTQLFNLLQFLIGGDKNGYNVLLTALTTETSIQDGSALYCLILCLVLAANLYKFYYANSNNNEGINIIQECLLNIHKVLHRCKSSSAQFILIAYTAMQKARDTSDIFVLVLFLLQMHRQKSSMVKPYLPLFHTSIAFDPMYQKDFPKHPIKALVIIELPKDETSTVTSDDVVPLSHGSDSQTESTFQSEINNPQVYSRSISEDEQFLEDIKMESVTEIQREKSIEAVIENGFCNLCGKNIINETDDSVEGKEENKVDALISAKKEMNDYDSHLKSDAHLIEVKEHSAYFDMKHATEAACNELITELEAVLKEKKWIDVESLQKKCRNEIETVTRTESETLKRFQWSDGKVTLQQCLTNFQKWRKEYHDLKTKYDAIESKHYAEEEMEENIIPDVISSPKLSKRKRNRKS